MQIDRANRVFLAAQAGALLVIVLFLADIALSRHEELSNSEERTRRFNAMMAEHTARTFDAVDILLRELSGDINRNHPDWTRWNEDEGWNYLAQNHSRSMPQLRSLLLYDAQGKQRFNSIPAQGHRLDVAEDIDYLSLRDSQKISRAGPYPDPRSGQQNYALSHRLTDPSGNFNGMLLATLEPVYLQDFCWPNRLTEDFESVLINTSGKIVATCRPSDQGRLSGLLGQSYAEALYEGALRNIELTRGSHHREQFVYALNPVPLYPELRMLTVVPESSLLTPWRNRLAELGLIATLIVGFILSGGFMMRRELQKNAAMQETLRRNNAELEARIADATRQVSSQLDTAELANVAKSRFLAAASHDLRQPMHALNLFAADLQAQSRTGIYRDLPQLAAHISQSSSLLSSLLDSLLDVSRLDVSGITPEIRHFPLQEVLDRLQLAHTPNALDKKIRLRIRPSALWLHTDPMLLERMLGNLLSNAIRYTARGGKILLAARRRKNRIRIEVRDNGIGIAPEQQTAIFAEFYQVANSARESHQGLGLGLSIVERLSTALQIPVSLRSALSRGTVFMLDVGEGQAQQLAAATTVRPPAGTLHFIGDSEALDTCRQLASSWDFTTSAQTSAEMPLPSLPYNTVVVSDLALAGKVRAIWPGDLTMILLVPEDAPPQALVDLPEGSLLYKLPIRPAKLRALLQNTSSKSMP